MSEHTMIDGQLYIDTDNGTLTFIDTDSRLVLRVTHLPDPVPADIMIDMVSLPALTSYHPLAKDGKLWYTATADPGRARSIPSRRSSPAWCRRTSGQTRRGRQTSCLTSTTSRLTSSARPRQ